MDIEKILHQLTLEEKASLCSGRDFWHTKAIERLGIPSVMMCDGPHSLRKQIGEGDHLGINESIKTVCYPTASALASSFDREALSELGHALGRECQAEDVSMLLGPGLNIKRSPLCGRNFEYFSEDPYLAGELGAAYIKALQEEGVSACVKHFAANNQETARMSGSSDLDERTLHEIYLPAFEAAVKKGKTRGVMCAYNAVNGVFCAENSELLTHILREQWGYEGFVVTDWGAVKDRVQGLLAGLDLEMPGGLGTQDGESVRAVKSGELAEEALDKAVRNMLTFIDQCVQQRKPAATVDRAELSRISGELSAKCAVLLKNDGTLPLTKSQRVAFIGEFAASPRYQGGGSSHINVPHPVSAVESAPGIPYARGYDAHGNEEEGPLVEEAVSLAKRSDVAVLFVGQTDAYESEGFDRETMELPGNQVRLIEAVAKVQPNVVLVLHGGSAVLLPFLDKVRAVLCMHLGGERVGEAAVKLLYGEADPSGKLAETWPLRLEDNPSFLNFPGHNGVTEYREGIYVGYRYYDKKKLPVQFPFGHGLSYTSFEYSNLALDAVSFKEGGAIKVTCSVKNTGTRTGSEVVQLYVSEHAPRVARPKRELRGFAKIKLAPGQSGTVSFELGDRDFAYYEPRVHDWFVESGKYLVEISASSRDIRLSAQVDVLGTEDLPMVYTRSSTVSDLLKSPKGRAFMSALMSKIHPSAQEESDNLNHMGEGSDKAAQKMMMEMPLSSLVTFGRMSSQELSELLSRLNSVE